MKLARFVALCVAIAALSACSFFQPAPPAPPPVVASAPVAVVNAPVKDTAPTDPLSALRNFTIADLQAASADAHAQTPPDQTAYQCYDFLVATLPTLPGFQQGQTVGAVLAFQKLRDLNNGLGSVNGALKSLNLACAPLVIDTQTVINKLLLLGAGAAATGGTVAPIVAPLVP